MDPISTTAAIGSGLQLFNEVAKKLKTAKEGVDSYSKNGSLIDIAQVARVEPLLIIDADVMNVPYLGELSQTMQTLFTGYYLQAVNLLGTIGGVSLAKKLSPLNPNRGRYGMESYGEPSTHARPDWRYAAESYKHRLPTTHNKLAMEDEEKRLSYATDKDAIKDMKDVSNLATGRLYNVTITEGAQSAVVPVSIRMMVNMIPTKSVLNMFTFKDSIDMDLKERYHSWRSGRISFTDLILCTDLVDTHRTALINDKDGVYSTILGRENANKRAGAFTKNPSLATASNLAVVSTDTVAAMENKLHGKISNFKIRKTLFDNTNLMILAVVDKGWDQITFYFRGIQDATSVSEKGLRSANKDKGGADVMDIMKQLLSGSGANI